MCLSYLFCPRSEDYVPVLFVHSIAVWLNRNLSRRKKQHDRLKE